MKNLPKTKTMNDFSYPTTTGEVGTMVEQQIMGAYSPVK